MIDLTPTSLRAFHGDIGLKHKLIEELERHYVTDKIIKNRYAMYDVYGNFEGGCAVGCTLHSLGMIVPTGSSIVHSFYPKLLGIPVEIAFAQDWIFEGLPKPLHLRWPIEFTEAITPGADLSMVWARLVIWLLSDPVLNGWYSYADTTDLRASIKALYIEAVDHGRFDKTMFRAVYPLLTPVVTQNHNYCLEVYSVDSMGYEEMTPRHAKFSYMSALQALVDIDNDIEFSYRGPLDMFASSLNPLFSTGNVKIEAFSIRMRDELIRLLKSAPIDFVPATPKMEFEYA